MRGYIQYFGCASEREAKSVDRALQSMVLNSANTIEEVCMIEEACRTTEAPPRGRKVSNNITSIYHELEQCSKSKRVFAEVEGQELPPLGVPLSYIPPSPLCIPRAASKVSPEDVPSTYRTYAQYHTASQSPAIIPS